MELHDRPCRWEIIIAPSLSGFLIQGAFGAASREPRVPLRGNFEMVTPLAAGRLAHYWRDNDAVGLPWHGPFPFGAAGPVDSVALIQSDFGFPGNLEVVVRVGDQLEHYWRDSGPAFAWHGPFFIANAAITVPDVSGASLQAARLRITRAGLAVGRVRTIPPEPGRGRVGPPTVVDQSPPADTPAHRGDLVDLTMQRVRIEPFPRLTMAATGGQEL